MSEVGQTYCTPIARAIEIFRDRGGVMRMAGTVRMGVLRRTLYWMRDLGQLEQMSRGLYRLADIRKRA